VETEANGTEMVVRFTGIKLSSRAKPRFLNKNLMKRNRNDKNATEPPNFYYVLCSCKNNLNALFVSSVLLERLMFIIIIIIITS
jgi:hypothetical protein